MASPIEQSWVHATVLIETGAGSRGTGFLVGRSAGTDQWRIFLVTNKHVLDQDPARRAAMASVRLHLNVSRNDVLQAQTIDYPLADASGSRVREHPTSEIDVLVIAAVPLFNNLKDIANKFVPETMFAPAEKRKELDITAGEEVVVVGYPSGIRQGRTNLPLIRQGIIATRIGEELHEEEALPGGGTRTRVTRGFLIDGATIPGSSGSPVILKPVAGRHQGNVLMLGSAPPVLLGIVAETRFAPIRVNTGVIPGFAGLGLAFDVETIVEVLNLF